MFSDIEICHWLEARNHDFDPTDSIIMSKDLHKLIEQQEWNSDTKKLAHELLETW